MQLDSRTVLSDQQAITADAASTDYIDLGADRDIGSGQPLWFVVYLDEAFNTLTSLDIKLQSDSDSGFATNLLTHISQNFLLAALTPAGQRLVAFALPLGIQRYVRAYFDVNGSNPSTGKLTAAIVANISNARFFAKGYSN